GILGWLTFSPRPKLWANDGQTLPYRLGKGCRQSGNWTTCSSLAKHRLSDNVGGERNSEHATALSGESRLDEEAALVFQTLPLWTASSRWSHSVKTRRL